MKNLTKIFWAIKNTKDWLVLTIRGGSGALTHRKKEEDYLYTYGANNEAIADPVVASRFLYQFQQSPFNICIYAAGTAALSEQLGFRFSIRWAVKNGRRLGYIKGNGWSYLRAFLDVAHHVGMVPYELMPDETSGFSWEEYSKWTKEDEKLLDVASHFKIQSYEMVRNVVEARHALGIGSVLFTAGNWYTAMNAPQPTAYALKYEGKYVGGHAYRITDGATGYWFEAPQTFGAKYGDNGKGYINSLFNKEQAAVYVMISPKKEDMTKYFSQRYNGWVLRTKEDAKCYLIENGLKRWIKSTEDFDKLVQSHTFKSDVENLVLSSLPNGEDYS